MMHWHDNSNGRAVRWSYAMQDSKSSVDIASQVKQTLAMADEDYSDN